MGRDQSSICAAALRDPNKIGGGYVAPASQCPFVARGAAFLGDFLARSASAGAAALLQRAELGEGFGQAHQIPRIVEYQALSRSDVVTVAWRPSHSRAQASDNWPKWPACRLIANLTGGRLGAIEVGAGRARRTIRQGPPAPPFGPRPKPMTVASGRPSPSENCLPFSTRSACVTERGGELSFGRMGSGVWAALARDQRSGVGLGRKGLVLINGVGGWQPLGVRRERANPAKLLAIGAAVNGVAR